MEQHQTWRQKIKQRPIMTIVVIAASALGIALIVAIFLGYELNWSWTGLVPYSHPDKDIIFQREKTLWDWMQLLFIPAVLAVGGFLFNLTVSRNERKTTVDNQCENALQAYLDKIAELLLKEHLGDPNVNGEIRKIARVRTLTVLRGLDSVRKGTVLQFLHESDLIKRFGPNPILVLSNGPDWVSLRVADLSWANLQGADLHDADLNGTNLHFADLYQAQLLNTDLNNADLRDAKLIEANLNLADLHEADLTKANLCDAKLIEANLNLADLHDADLTRADLTKANLRGAVGTTPEQLEKAKSLQGATMPDGKVHP